MRQTTGKTYGFGRVSEHTRPSPYSPFHLPSVSPAMPPPSASSPGGRVRRRRRVAGALAVAAVAATSVLVAAMTSWLRS
jgi:hypothetical protein